MTMRDGMSYASRRAEVLQAAELEIWQGAMRADRHALLDALVAHVEATCGPIRYPAPPMLSEPLTFAEVEQVAAKACVTLAEAVMVLDEQLGILKTKQARVLDVALCLLTTVGGDGPLLPEVGTPPGWSERAHAEWFAEQRASVEAELAAREARRRTLIAEGKTPRAPSPEYVAEQARRRDAIAEWHAQRERLAGDDRRAADAQRDRELSRGDAYPTFGKGGRAL